MTKPRLSTTRELFGILGSFEGSSQLQAAWNRLFEEKGLDAFMDKYPTTAKQLPERLSEMFHFDRRGYIVSFALQEAIFSLLDDIDASAKEEKRVDTILNRGGVLVGFFLDDDEKRRQLWL